MQNNEVLKPAKYFSELEKNVLLALVEKYKYVLECKKSDARTIALKQRTWQALAHEYNSQPSVSLRDFKQLKKCWENIKARTKKIMAHERREKVKRCGPASDSHQALKDKVASMIPEQLYFVPNPQDDESGYNHDTSNHDIDCKRVNLLDLELLIDEQGKIQTKPFRKVSETNSLCGEGSPPRSLEKAFHKGDLELLIDEEGKIQTEPVRKVPLSDSMCAEGSSPNSLKKAFHKGDLELLIDEQGKIQTEPIRKGPLSDSMCVDGSSPSGLKKAGRGKKISLFTSYCVLQQPPQDGFESECQNKMLPPHLLTDSACNFKYLKFYPDSFVVPDRDLYVEEKALVNMHDCEITPHPAPSCSSTRITGNRTYRSKNTHDNMIRKMHEEEHHQQMSILQLQLIQMNEVHVAKVQQIERECEMAEEEHRIKMEILNKKKMYWERKLQTITKEWPVASFNRPFPNSP
ncbi:myb SANT-like DNA-binding domain-containing 3 [Pelobates cultripes]|uniref:Myb/SANT-like DNA-binding domain-containing protein 3 n=1 Tax=Pelobates cultripes TaxID=61616 RepID=A0AAD1RXV1_PELCU|nr:myb SANT-like DNA-binding domain-containing 3 [Pelobates cultripes]